jgi:hypothetical protein
VVVRYYGVETLGVTSGRLRGAYAHAARPAMHGRANWLDDDATRDSIEIDIAIDIDIDNVPTEHKRREEDQSQAVRPQRGRRG